MDNSPHMHDHQRSTHGIIFAASAFLFLGLTPLYYRPLDHVGAAEILTHRIIWTVVMIPLILIALRQVGRVASLFKSPRTIGLLCISGAMIVSNWFIFVWAITHERVLETSLGYFISPFFSVLLGTLFLHERLRPAQQVAVFLAAIGVLYLIFNHGSLPWVALALPLLFGLYGLMRKKISVDPLGGLWIETAMVAPFAAMYAIYLWRSGESHFGAGHAQDTALLLLGGPVTIIPLTLFAAAVRRINLSTIAFIQYLAPTLTFIVAVFIFHEAFGRAQLVTFSFIWLSLAIFTLDGLRFSRYSARQSEIPGTAE